MSSSISRVDAFLLGRQFQKRLQECWDSRDIGRMLTCEDFPPEVQSLADRMNGFKTKDHGICEAVSLINQLLEQHDQNEPKSEASDE